jgi:hypothetical protein
MGKSALRKMVSCVLLFLFPAFSFAADSNAAMLYTNGPAWVNGAHLPRPSSAIFAGDLLQTRSDSVATINAPGARVTVLSDSLVQFQGASLTIEHGGLTISTSKRWAAVAGDVQVEPVSDSWTEFDVSDVNGTVNIAARKGDLKVTDESGTSTLAQGQQTTRDETSDQADNSGKSKKKRSRGATPGAVPAAGGGILNSPWAIGIGGGAILGLTTWVLIKSDNPASPSNPN